MPFIKVSSLGICDAERAAAVNCVLGRRLKGRKENILGVEKLSTDFPPSAFRWGHPQRREYRSLNDTDLFNVISL